MGDSTMVSKSCCGNRFRPSSSRWRNSIIAPGRGKHSIIAIEPVERRSSRSSSGFLEDGLTSSTTCTNNRF
jgi:hypothetical protein